MRYYKTTDVWEAIAVAAAQNNDVVYDPTTLRLVEVTELGGNYYVMRLRDMDYLGLPHVDYDDMATYFPAIE